MTISSNLGLENKVTFSISVKIYEQIHWAKISGLRHRLAHDYENINWSLVCAILFEELPGFLTDLQEL